MKANVSPAAFILSVLKVEGHVLTFVGYNILMLNTFNICIRSINYNFERRLARQKV